MTEAAWVRQIGWRGKRVATLLAAVRSGDVRLVRAALRAGCDPDARGGLAREIARDSPAILRLLDRTADRPPSVRALFLAAYRVQTRRTARGLRLLGRAALDQQNRRGVPF